MKPQEELRLFKMSVAQGFAPHTASLLIMHQEIRLHQQRTLNTFRLLDTSPPQCPAGLCSWATARNLEKSFSAMEMLQICTLQT